MFRVSCLVAHRRTVGEKDILLSSSLDSDLRQFGLMELRGEAAFFALAVAHLQQELAHNLSSLVI